MKDLKIFHIEYTCTGCGACVSACPKNCLVMGVDHDGFYFPQYRINSCIECHFCEKVCHILNPQEKNTVVPGNSFIFWHKDENIRQESSSGGTFTLFAQHVMQRGGAVYGSRYNPERERLEVTSSDICGLEPLKKSKYVESYLGDAFFKIGNDLLNDRLVLYCGTPCQAAGLKQYLAKRHISTNNLILIDFACHGVPTNKLLTDFKREFEINNRKVVDIVFRHKDFKDNRCPWHELTMKLKFSDETYKVIYSHSYYYYYYYHFFDISNCLRRSCYNCHLVDNSVADITIGDFWDIAKYRKEIDDNKGISFLKFHNSKWLNLFIQLSEHQFVEKLPDEILTDPYNKQSKMSLLPEREKFLTLIRMNGYVRGRRKYYGIKGFYKYFFITSLKAFVRRVLLLTIWKKRK